MSEELEDKVNVVTRPLSQLGFAFLAVLLIGVNLYCFTQLIEIQKESNLTSIKQAVAIQSLTNAIEYMNHR